MRRPSRAAAPVALALLLPLLAGCAAGKEAQTSQVRNHPDSSAGRASEVLLRHVRIPSPGIEGAEAGSNVRVYGSIISSPDGEDELVSVSTEAAQRAVVRPAEGESGPIEIPADTRVELGPDGGYVELINLTEKLRGGTFVTITFTFRENGDAVIDVPVETLTDE